MAISLFRRRSLNWFTLSYVASLATTVAVFSACTYTPAEVIVTNTVYQTVEVTETKEPMNVYTQTTSTEFEMTESAILESEIVQSTTVAEQTTLEESIPTIQVGNLTIPDPRLHPKSKRFFYSNDAIVDGEMFTPPIVKLVNTFIRKQLNETDEIFNARKEIAVEDLISNVVFHDVYRTDGRIFIIGTSSFNQTQDDETGIPVGEIPIFFSELNEKNEQIIASEPYLRLLFEALGKKTSTTGTYFSEIPGSKEMVTREFSAMFTENDLKWHLLVPEKGEINQKRQDHLKSLIQLAKNYDMEFIGNGIIWWESIPEWIETGNYNQQELIQFIEEHFRYLFSTFPEIHKWVIVKEYHPKTTYHKDFWQKKFGGDYEIIDISYELADKVAREFGRIPGKDIFFLYGDTQNHQQGLPNYISTKSIVDRLLSRGLIHGVTMHMHLEGDNYPNSSEIQAAIEGLGIDMVFPNETDVNMRNVNKSDMFQRELINADAFVQVVTACLDAKNKEDKPICPIFGVWTPGDDWSWLEYDGLIKTGDPRYTKDADPTMFYGDLEPKPSYYAILQTLWEYIQNTNWP